MLNTQYIPYCTVAVLCMVALIHFSANIKKYAPNNVANRCFRITIQAAVVCAFMEFLFAFHESGSITNPVYCYATEICYSVSSLVMAFFWFLFSEIKQRSRTVRNAKNTVLCALPIIFMAGIVITTPLHHQAFYFTEDGHYVRGIFNTPLVLITAVYIAKSGFFALIKAFQRKHYLNRRLFLTFFYYALALVIAQLFQIAFGFALPFRIVGAVIIFYILQEQNIKQNIYIDVLSNANNRTAMEKYLKNHFDTADERFTFVMIDMDGFKQINDHYGHSAGDLSIRLIAKAFQLTLPGNLFFARYGGDEFVLIGKTNSTQEINRLMDTVRFNLQQLTQNHNLPFYPDFSFGIAYKTADIKTIPDLMNRADTAMYENKKFRKASRLTKAI